MDNLKEISKQTIERYSNRYKAFGKDIKTLGWGNLEQQEYRFRNTLSSSDFSGKSVVDIGCGFGDYFNFLKKNSVEISSYSGWELNKDLLENLERSNNLNASFRVVDIGLDDLSIYSSKFNIGIMLGLINFNLQSQELNYEYSKKLIKNAFTIVKDVLVVDFLSTQLTPEYPKENFVFYHDPLKMLEFAFTLTPNVILKHDYAPIPQKEFMLFLYK